jgi:hypothetical protein
MAITTDMMIQAVLAGNVSGAEDDIRNFIANFDEKLAAYDYDFTIPMHQGVVWLVLTICDHTLFFMAVDELKWANFVNSILGLLDGEFNTECFDVPRGKENTPYAGFHCGYYLLEGHQPVTGCYEQEFMEMVAAAGGYQLA